MSRESGSQHGVSAIEGSGREKRETQVAREALESQEMDCKGGGEGH